jgi:DNA-binding transcriptional LysR family regulator
LASLRNLDLHTLECFDMLMRERSVSRAAERLGMSQSSASEALARLRERFADPLVVRGRDGMVPTPRALELLPQVRDLIAQLQALMVQEQPFDARATELRFWLAASDYTQMLLMPILCRRLGTEAPKCALGILPVHILRVEEALATAELDLAIAYFPDPPPGLRRQVLFNDDYVCIVRPGHPCLARTLDPESFAALSHVTVAPSGLSFFSSAVDSALDHLGLARTVTVSSPHFLLAAHLVSQSDLALALPRQAALAVASHFPVKIIEIPMRMRKVDIAMYWHERTHHSKAHQWLRHRVREVLAPERLGTAAALMEREAA